MVVEDGDTSAGLEVEARTLGWHGWEALGGGELASRSYTRISTIILMTREHQQTQWQRHHMTCTGLSDIRRDKPQQVMQLEATEELPLSLMGWWQALWQECCWIWYLKGIGCCTGTGGRVLRICTCAVGSNRRGTRLQGNS